MLIRKLDLGKQYKTSIRILIGSILMLYILTACGSDKKEIVDQPLDRETTPSIRDDSVTMFISDSGVIRFKVVTKDWQVFDASQDPHWFFPEGLYVERFDSVFAKEVTIQADTAWNFTQRRMWRLKGHVFVKNIKDETFSTDELFWNERDQKVYSDKYIEINRPEKLSLKGFGFESNMNMTQYRVFRPHDTDLYVNESQETAPTE